MSRFVGVQVPAISVFDEGADHCLDLLQETAHVNAVVVYSFMYYGTMPRSPQALADHGVPKVDGRSRDYTYVFSAVHDEYYSGTVLRHRSTDADGEYAGRDVLAELSEPCARRGMKLYARILEPFHPEMVGHVPNWAKVLSLDCYDRPHFIPCSNNPD